MNTEKHRPDKFGVNKGTQNAGEFKELCKAEEIKLYSTMNETEAAFAERAIRPLKTLLYRYMETFVYKYLHKMTQFVGTLTFRRNCSVDLIPKNVKKSDFLPILYSKQLRNFGKLKFKSGDSLFFLQGDLLLRVEYKPQCTQEVFEIVAFYSKKLSTNTIKDEQDEIIRGEFYQRETIKII